MKTKLTFYFAMILLILTLLFAPATAYVQRVGIPRLNSIVAETETDPEIAYARFLAGDFDYYPDIVRFSDREALEVSGHQVVGTPGFHVCEIEINCRDYVPADAGQPDAGRSLWPLNDTAFRLALAWSGLSIPQKETSIADIYGPGMVVPAYSKVPEALGVWHNPTTPKPGGNYTKALEFLTDAGYYVSVGELYGPNDVSVRNLEVLSPSGSPTEVEFCQRFVDQWNDFFDNFVGVTNCNFINTPVYFNTLIVNAFIYRNFDLCWMSHHLGGFPDYLYDMFHSSQEMPWGGNKVGINDSELDAYVETIKWGFDYTAIQQACWDTQERLYELSSDINVYHRIYWQGIRGTDPDALVNYINQDGTGTDNDWTWSLMHWASSDTGGTVNYVWGGTPDNLHPGWADTVYEIWLLDRISYGLTATTTPTLNYNYIINIALNWSSETFTWPPFAIDLGMKIIFNIRNDLYWNDGFPITVEDIKFSLEFMRNFPRFYPVYENLLWIDIVDSQTVTIYLDTASQFIVSDLAKLALWFPQHIYDPNLHPTIDTIYDDPSLFYWDDWMADFNWTKWTEDYGMPDVSGSTGFPYTALVNCGPYDLVNYDPALELATLVKHNRPGDFFHDSPIEVAINTPGRIGKFITDPTPTALFNGTFEYYITVVNSGSKDNITGELTPIDLDYYEVYIDDVLDISQPIGTTLDPFDYLEVGPHTTALTPGRYNMTVALYESGVAEPIDVSSQMIVANVLEDLNCDFKINAVDVFLEMGGFGAAPPPFPGSEHWDPRLDRNNDFVIDIFDMIDYVYVTSEAYFPWDVTCDSYGGIDDIVATAEHFGTYPGGPPNPLGNYYEAIYDVNLDNYIGNPDSPYTGVDDIVEVAEHFGDWAPYP